MIVSYNGTELTSNAILRWCSERRIEWHCIAPGKPSGRSGAGVAFAVNIVLRFKYGPGLAGNAGHEGLAADIFLVGQHLDDADHHPERMRAAVEAAARLGK